MPNSSQARPFCVPLTASANPFVEFRARYYYTPDVFVRQVLGGEPDAKQTELLLAVARGERRVAVRSGHGVGKTTVLAWLVVWWICTRYPQKTVCTAPTQGQLFDALAAETKTWISKLPQGVRDGLEVQTEQILLKARPTASFVSFKTSRPEKPEALAGVHSDNVLLIGDEASGIPDAVFEAAVGSMSGHTATTVLAGNPVRSSGYFYDSFNSPDVSGSWYKVHISCVGHPRVTPDFVEEIRQRYGENSNQYRVRVLGEFPLADDDTVIPWEYVEMAKLRDVKPLLVRPLWGLDVGRFGSDPSALARRRGNVLEALDEKRGLDTMQCAGWVKRAYDDAAEPDKPTEILVDVIGVGAGVLDRLVELGLPARGVNVAEAPAIFDDKYLNLRAELWFQGREWFGRKDCRLALAGKPLAKLAAELVAPRFQFGSNGKIKVESKEDMKHRLPKIGSPNMADAFLLTLAGEHVSAANGSSDNKRWNKPLRRKIGGLV